MNTNEDMHVHWVFCDSQPLESHMLKHLKLQFLWFVQLIQFFRVQMAKPMPLRGLLLSSLLDLGISSDEVLCVDMRWLNGDIHEASWSIGIQGYSNGILWNMEWNIMESQPALLGCHVYFCNYRSIGRIFLWLPRHVTSYQCVHAMQGRAGRDALIFLVPCDRLTQMRTRKMLSCGETVEQLWLCRMTRMRTSQNQCTHWKMASRQSLLWLLCAWSPVFYIFLSSRHSLVTSISELKKIEAHLMTSWRATREPWWNSMRPFLRFSNWNFCRAAADHIADQRPRPWCGHCQKLEPEYNQAAEARRTRSTFFLKSISLSEQFIYIHLSSSIYSIIHFVDFFWSISGSFFPQEWREPRRFLPRQFSHGENMENIHASMGENTHFQLRWDVKYVIKSHQSSEICSKLLCFGGHQAWS